MAFDAADLSPHEQYVIDRTREGEVADFTPMASGAGGRPAVRAGFLRKLLLQLDPNWPVRLPGVRIKGARIEGALDLSDCAGANGLPALELIACEIPEPMDFRHARLARLSLCDTAFSHLKAHALTLDGPFDFRRAHALGEDGPCWIDGYGLRVGGDAQGLGARLVAPPAADGDYALVLVNAAIGGSLDLARDKESGQDFRAVGGVSFSNARIGRELWMTSAVVDAGAADAIRARGLEVGGAVALNSAKISGCVVFSSATIALNLDLRGADITSPHRKNGAPHTEEYALAIDAVGARVGGAILLQGANVRGELFMSGARIDGYLAFGGGRFMNAGGWAIRAPNVRIGGNLTLKLTDDETAPHGRKTVIQGGAKFDRVLIDGAVSWLNLELRGPGPDAARGPVLSFADARIEGALEARNLTAQEEARIDLSGASCNALDDDLKTGWGMEKATLALEGFAYNRLDGGGRDDRWRARLNWLRRSRGEIFSPQPYTTLADVYARTGLRDDARRVLLAQHDLRTAHAPAGPLTRVFSSLFGLIAGYGLAPIRAVRALALYLALGIVGVLAMDATGALVTPQGRPCAGAIEPALYAIDVAVPVIDLGQQSKCAPGRAAGSDLFRGVALQGTDWRLFEGVALWRWGEALYALLGALLTALAVITFSGVLKPKSDD